MALVEIIKYGIVIIVFYLMLNFYLSTESYYNPPII